jgi:hypothetical protein
VIGAITAGAVVCLGVGLFVMYRRKFRKNRVQKTGEQKAFDNSVTSVLDNDVSYMSDSAPDEENQISVRSEEVERINAKGIAEEAKRTEALEAELEAEEDMFDFVPPPPLTPRLSPRSPMSPRFRKYGNNQAHAQFSPKKLHRSPQTPRGRKHFGASPKMMVPSSPHSLRSPKSPYVLRGNRKMFIPPSSSSPTLEHMPMVREKRCDSDVSSIYSISSYDSDEFLHEFRKSAKRVSRGVVRALPHPADSATHTGSQTSSSSSSSGSESSIEVSSETDDDSDNYSDIYSVGWDQD